MRKLGYLLFTFSVIDLSLAKLTCRNFQGKAVKHGQEFKPDAIDLCKVCLCDQGFPTMCRSVSCSPPSCPNWEQVKNECCQFTCLDDLLPPTVTTKTTNNTSDIVTSADSLTTLGLRLVASTVTSFLVLALLLFAVHQLRRKRLILAMRRYSESRRRQENYQSEVFTPDYFGLECPPYEEPPPPYSPPKHPAEAHPDEAPPPYDSVDANHNLNSHVNSVATAVALSHPEEPTVNNSSNVSSPASSRISEVSRECSSDQRTHQHSSPLGQQHDTSSRNFTLPPWNTFRSPRSPNHEQFYSNSRPLQRGFSEISDIESDRASTDFGLTSDAESHYDRCDAEENAVLRDLRLSNLLSNSCSDSNTTTPSLAQGTEDLQNDAHYPENSLSNLTNLSMSSGYHGKVSCGNESDGINLSKGRFSSPDHCNTSTQSKSSPEKRKLDMVQRNKRNKSLKSLGHSFENKSISLKENDNDQNYSDV